MATVSLTIDGRRAEIEAGRTVLEAARSVGVEIPTLCHHPAVSAYGACRICLVEVTARGRTRMVTSCCYPATEGLEVRTQSERVVKARRGVMELLLARAPGSASLRDMAEKMGVTETRFPSVTQGEADCILCGLCVNVCREVMGAAAISFVGRGQDRKVAPPFYESSEACLGCGACAAVCPVGAVQIRWDDQAELAPFGNRPKVVRCQECGAPIAGQGMGERVREHLGEVLGRAVELCAACKRAATGAAVKKAEAAGSSWSVIRKEKSADG